MDNIPNNCLYDAQVSNAVSSFLKKGHKCFFSFFSFLFFFLFFFFFLELFNFHHSYEILVSQYVLLYVPCDFMNP